MWLKYLQKQRNFSEKVSAQAYDDHHMLSDCKALESLVSSGPLLRNIKTIFIGYIYLKTYAMDNK